MLKYVIPESDFSDKRSASLKNRDVWNPEKVVWIPDTSARFRIIAADSLGSGMTTEKLGLTGNWGFLASLVLHALLAALLIKAVFPVEEPPLIPVQVITLMEQLPVASRQSSVVSEAKQKPATSHQPPATHKAQSTKHKVLQKPIVSRQSSVVNKASDIRQQEASSQPATSNPSLATNKAKGTNNKVASSYSPASFDAAYLSNPAPEYPAAAKRRRMQGTVLLKVMVSAEGRAASVSLKQSSGFAPLDAAAENAVRRWRFIPAKRGETPVAASVVVPVEFRLTS